MVHDKNVPASIQLPKHSSAPPLSPAEEKCPKDEKGSDSPSLPDARLAVLVGNTRAIWVPFLEHLRKAPSISYKNPLNNYVECIIEDAVNQYLPCNYNPIVRFAHDTRPGICC